MEGVLDAALRVCVCKLMSSVLLCPSVVTHTITAVSLCCCCLLLFTDLAVTLFLLYVWLMEFWLMPLNVSSDAVALRFLLFLCQAYGVVLLLTPPLIAVELLVNLLRPQHRRTTGHLEQNASESDCLSRTIGCFGCLLAWIVSGIYSSHDWTLERFSVEACLKRGGCLVTCIPDMDELSWVLPAMMVLLSLMGSLGRLRSRSPSDSYRNAQMGEKMDYGVLRQMLMSLSVVDSEKRPNRCGVHRTGCVYSEQRWSCPGNDNQTGLADNYSQKQKLTTFAQSKTDLLPEVTSLAVKTEQCVFNRSQSKRCWLPERENPCWRRETLTGLVCMALVCVFPTVVSGNILLIFNLENLVVNTFKLLSHSVNRLPDL
ncbi:uncharacterized protein LOC143711930 [Siphateles boraxobius]|uniref:uncharacterized protein LOC143711930 n=1 Tax=Siphateles boraxobius TaxID=180520 RepID=UPI004063C716